MESVLGAGGRPNCLLIDEIDGAPTVGLPAAGVGRKAGWVPRGLRLTDLFRVSLKAAINVLLSILNRKGPQEAEQGGTAVPAGGRRRRAEGGLLTRPIICICNDQ